MKQWCHNNFDNKEKDPVQLLFDKNTQNTAHDHTVWGQKGHKGQVPQHKSDTQTAAT